MQQKILIVQIGKLGDMILTTPLFRNLKLLHPLSHITVLASETNAEIAHYNKSVDEVLVYSKNFLKTLRLLFRLKNENYDLWIDPKNEKSKTSLFLLKYAKPGKSIGYNFDERVFDIDLTGKETGKHAVDIYLTPLKVLSPDFHPDSRLPSLDIPIDSKEFVKPLLNNLSHKILFVNLTAGMPARHWDIQNWVELLRLLSENKDYDILVNTYDIPDEEVSGLKGKIPSAHFFPRKLTQLELAEVIKESSAVISPDTSVIHIASAFNIPVVDMMNNVEWNRERFAPLSEKQKVLISEESNSLKGITPDMVYRAFGELVKS